MAVGTGDITFSFDCGNGQNLVENDTNDFSFDAITTDQPYGAFWFGVKIENSAYHNQTVSFEIDDMDHGFFSATHKPLPVISYDGSNWQRISSSSWSSDTLSFSITFDATGTEVLIFPNPPFTYTAMNSWVSGLSSTSLKSEVLGTIDSKNLHLLTITEPASSNRGKKQVWITGGVHPGEVWGAWVVKGLVDFLLGNSETAAILRSQYVWKILPMANPDGVYQGRGYFNSEGYNIFEDFYNENTTNVTLIKDALDDWPWGPDMLIDCHCAIGQEVSTPYNRLHINDEVQGYTAHRIRQTSLKLAEILKNRTVMDNTADISRSANNTSIINHFINNKGCRQALVMEFCLMDPAVTVNSMLQQGQQVARSVHSYFGSENIKKIVA